MVTAVVVFRAKHKKFLNGFIDGNFVQQFKTKTPNLEEWNNMAGELAKFASDYSKGIIVSDRQVIILNLIWVKK